MPASTTGNLTAAGSVVLNKPATDTLAQLQLSGTYGSAIFAIESTIDGVNWVGIGAISAASRQLVTGSISPADNSTNIYDVESAGFAAVRARITSIGSGSAAFTIQSASYAHLPLVVPPAPNSSSIGSVGSTLAVLGLVAESTTNGITAFAGGGQGSAAALSTEINRVSTVATVGDSIRLPAAVAGLTLVVANTAANACNVFPGTGDTINGQAANAAVNQMSSSICFYCCSVNGSWFCEGIGGGYAGSFPTVSNANGLTALAGGAQAGTLIATSISRFTAVVTGADSAQLPVSTPGLQLTVVNAAASNSMNVFGQTGDKINALTANTAFAVAANKAATFYCCNAGQWHAILTA